MQWLGWQGMLATVRAKFPKVHAPSRVPRGFSPLRSLLIRRVRAQARHISTSELASALEDADSAVLLLDARTKSEVRFVTRCYVGATVFLPCLRSGVAAPLAGSCARAESALAAAIKRKRRPAFGNSGPAFKLLRLISLACACSTTCRTLRARTGLEKTERSSSSHSLSPNFTLGTRQPGLNWLPATVPSATGISHYRLAGAGVSAVGEKEGIAWR